MPENIRELRARRAELDTEARELLDTAEAEDRGLNDEEQTRYDELLGQIDGLNQRIENRERIGQAPPTPFENGGGQRRAPAHNRIPQGDNEIRALAHYVRTGDDGGVRELMDGGDSGSREAAVRLRVPTGLEMRAVTDSTMNITTAGDGGNLVPTGFVNDIAARRNEIRLAERLGVRMVPGTGTTVNYPFEAADPNVFAATAEQDDAHSVAYERDAVQTGLKAFTLAKKTRKLELTEELMDDEDVNLMAFISDHIGRAIGMTHNSLLLTEVAANGTSLKTFAGAAAIASGEPEDIVFNDTLSYYLNDADPASWVMRPTSYGAVASITGSDRQYAESPAGSLNQRTLLGYPVYYSNYAAAIAASAKSVYFGNWYYVGMREDPALRLIRDPYTVDGMVILKYSFRTVYGVLVAGAVGYAQHPSA